MLTVQNILTTFEMPKKRTWQMELYFMKMRNKKCDDE